MLFVIAYTASKAFSRRGTHWNIYGPTYLVVMAALFIMADLVRHVLQDLNWWPYPGSNQYRDNCPYENMSCLSVLGWFFTVVFTYTGFILLFIGTMWNANIVSKFKEIKKKWQSLRK